MTMTRRSVMVWNNRELESKYRFLAQRGISKRECNSNATVRAGAKGGPGGLAPQLTSLLC